MMIAPDWASVSGLPFRPSWSTMNGIAPRGLSFRNSGFLCSPLVISTLCTLCSSPHSASATAARRPLAVPHMYRSIMAFPSRGDLKIAILPPGKRSVDHLIRGQRQEFDVVAGGERLEELRARFVAAGAPGFLAERRAHLRQLLAEQRAEQFDCHLAAVIQPALDRACPLADLRTRDLGGRGVFHQVVHRHAAVAGQPGAEVLDADR